MTVILFFWSVSPSAARVVSGQKLCLLTVGHTVRVRADLVNADL